MKKKAPILCLLPSLVLAFSLFVGCKDNTTPTPVSCTVGDDSPCELWQRCLAEGTQGHCVGERECETSDNCPNEKACKGGTCVPSAYCEIGCPDGFVCVSTSCQPGCLEDNHCSGSKICGGRDTTGLGTCRNTTPTQNPEPVLCTVGDDSPCELWQRCLAEGTQGHCVGERQCETNDKCPQGKTCKDGTCVPEAYCEVGCPDGLVCVSGNCQPGCLGNSDCSDSKICGGRATTGLGTCRNPK